jgi:hypothetical protein
MVVELLLFETRGSWNGRGCQRARQAILVRYRVAAARQRGTFCKLRAVLGSVFGLLRDAD